MKIILTAINAKYIHSNLAVYSLKSYAKKYADCIEIAEFTINQQLDDILIELYKKKPDVLCFSCYIWNLTYVEELIREISKIIPGLPIWLGGPEVSYDSESVLRRLPWVSGVIIGEGEETFVELAGMYLEGKKDLRDIRGLSYRGLDGHIRVNQCREVMDLNAVPFIYDNIEQFENKIVYYETSRGCPFSCSYCLSSIDKYLRFRKFELVEKELQFFLDHKVPQVKFVDRTFNCNHSHSMKIWSYLLEHDNKVTNFHFEIAADLLNEDELNIISRMRPGLIQLEIGVQSTNPGTLKEICRVMDFSKVNTVVQSIRAAGNIHQHLDLIAGLPFEGYQSFRQSFNDVYKLYPEQMQLGFLKVLKGSDMERKKELYGLVYKGNPPYEVLSTKWLSYDEVLKLKVIEAVVEIYYNSGQFAETIKLLESAFKTPFDFYEALGNFYERHKLHLQSHSRVARYEILLLFAIEADGKKVALYKELLTYDLYLRENMKNRPEFAGVHGVSKEQLQMIYDREESERRFLKGYEGYDKRQLRKMTHVEKFSINFLEPENPKPMYVLFDYKNRSPLTHQAATFVWGEE